MVIIVVSNNTDIIITLGDIDHVEYNWRSKQWRILINIIGLFPEITARQIVTINVVEYHCKYTILWTIIWIATELAF